MMPAITQAELDDPRGLIQSYISACHVCDISNRLPLIHEYPQLISSEIRKVRASNPCKVQKQSKLP